MSLDQIRYFVAVAEEGSVRKAAHRVRVSQPPITRHIASLEDELGGPLFRRKQTGMELAPLGEQFLLHAKKILAAVDEAKRIVMAEAQRSSSGPMSRAST